MRTAGIAELRQQPATLQAGSALTHTVAPLLVVVR
jgi:hypothetical protein